MKYIKNKKQVKFMRRKKRFDSGRWCKLVFYISSWTSDEKVRAKLKCVKLVVIEGYSHNVETF